MQPIFNILPRSVLYLFWTIVIVHFSQFIIPETFYNFMINKMVFIPFRYFNMETISYDPVATIISPFAYSFLHADFTHLFMNMSLFIPFGMVVARTIGNMGFGFLYHLGAIGGAYFSYAITPESTIPMVGASASVSALVGFIVSSSILGIRFMAPFSTLKNTIIFFVAWFVLNVVYPYLFAHSISWEAHLGGFVVGFVSAFAFIHNFRKSV